MIAYSSFHDGECCHCQGEASDSRVRRTEPGKICCCCATTQHDTIRSRNGPWTCEKDTRTGGSKGTIQVQAQAHQKEAEVTRSPALSGAVLAKLWPKGREAGGRRQSNHRLPHPQRLWRALIIGVRDFWASTQHMNIGIAGSPKRGLMWSSRAHLWWLLWLLGKKRVAVARAGPLKAQGPRVFRACRAAHLEECFVWGWTRLGKSM